MKNTKEIIKCENCNSTDVEITHHVAPPNNYVGEQEVTFIICHNCGYTICE